MLFRYLALGASINLALAQRPSNTSICDYYTTALLKNNTAANQKTLLTLVVNTAVIGNYTQPNVGISVAGILAPGTYNGEEVDLAPYFDGGFASTNRGGMTGVSKNFLDGGGAAPLMQNMPANNTMSNQYTLLTHLYEYFGTLLGCSMQGGGDYSAYNGDNSMYQVHKFMDLSAAEVGYFVSQVANAAASFGVAQEDLTVIGDALSSLFGHRCSAPTVVVPSQPAGLQAICIDSSCPLAANATCSVYGNTTKPSIAVSSLVPSMSATATTGISSTGVPLSTSFTGAAAVRGWPVAAGAVGLAALLL